MKVKIPEVAEKQGIAPAVLHMLWLEFLPKIRFVAVGGPPKNGNWRDPKDVPYLRLQRKLQYPIVSADPHLPAMGARVIHVQMLNPLRGYSRAAAIEYQLKFSGALSGSLLAAFTQSMASAVRRIPTPVLIGMAILGALALAQPNSRKRIFEIGTDLLAGAAIAGGALIEAINPMLEAHAAAQREAQLQLSTVKATLASANHLAPHRADISSAGG